MSLPLVCVALSGCTVDEMLKDAAKATAVGADLVEVRLDRLWVEEKKNDPLVIESEGGNGRTRTQYVESDFIPQSLDSVDLDNALISFKTGIELPVILTCRPKRQGGYFPGTEDERLEVLRKAIESGVSWIDLEIDIESKARADLVKLAGKSTRIIASQHADNSQLNTDDIAQEIEDNSAAGEIIKFCYETTGKNDGLRLFDAAWNLKDSDIKVSLMGVGMGGDWSRIHAPLLGQSMVYTTMETGWHLAQQGRINASDLQVAWNLLEYN